MKACSLLAAFVAIFIVSCAKKPTMDKRDPLQKFSQVIPKHSEVCVAATEEDIAALFDRWNASLQTGDVHQVSAQIRLVPTHVQPSSTDGLR
jgi:hypothetical protein